MLKTSLKSIARNWKYNSIVQLTTLSVLTGVFFVMIIFSMIFENLDGLLTRWGQEVQMTVFLDDDISLTALETLQTQIKAEGVVDSVAYVSKDEAAKTFLAQMGSMAPDFLTDKKFGNPLPASLEVQLKSSASKASSIDQLVGLAERLTGTSGVEDVSYGQGWVENYSSIVSQFGRSSWFVMLILLAGSLLIVGNAIRNSVNQRRDEIEVLELIGATSSRIKAPFVIEGSLLTFASACLALMLAYFFFAGQSLIADGSLTFLGLSTKLEFLSIASIALILLYSLSAGALGAWLCVATVSTGWSAAKRQEKWTR